MTQELKARILELGATRRVLLIFDERILVYVYSAHLPSGHFMQLNSLHKAKKKAKCGKSFVRIETSFLE